MGGWRVRGWHAPRGPTCMIAVCDIALPRGPRRKIQIKTS